MAVPEVPDAVMISSPRRSPLGHSSSPRPPGPAPGLPMATSAPQDFSEPHMPEVETQPDVSAIFAKAREGSAYTVHIVTPGRMRMEAPPPPQGSMPPEEVNQAKGLLGGDRPLHVTVVAYTKLEALMKDRETPIRSMGECIPFLGHLMGMAYVGHSVVVFEGHPVAFEAGVRNADV